MPSAIDPSIPVTGTPTTESVRGNFAAAKAEIEALQNEQRNYENARQSLGVSYAPVYTCPADTIAVVLMAQAANVDGVNSAEVSARWIDSSAADVATRLVQAYPVAAKSADMLTGGPIILEAGDEFQATANAAGMIELSMTVQTFPSASNPHKNAGLPLGVDYAPVYTCPADTIAVVLTAQAANVDGVNSAEVSARWLDSSAGDVATRLVEAYPVAAKSADMLNGGPIILEAGDEFQAKANAAGMIELTLAIREIAQ